MATEELGQNEKLRELKEEGKTAEEILEDNEETLNRWTADFYIRYKGGKEEFNDLNVEEKANYLIEIIESDEEPYEGLEFKDDDYDLERIAELASINRLPLKTGSELDYEENQTVAKSGNLIMGAPSRANRLKDEYDIEGQPIIAKDVDHLDPDRE